MALKRYEAETATDITLTGSWVKVNDPPLSGGASIEGRSVGASAMFNFTGTRLDIIGILWAASVFTTSTSVYIDDLKITDFSQQGTGLNYQNVNFSKSGLSNAEHYVSIINNDGLRFVFDAVDIDSEGVLKPYNSNITAINKNQASTGGV